MEDRTKRFLVGGVAFLGGALCAWYFYEKRHLHPVRRTHKISKSLWGQILKDQEREFYSVLKVIAELSKEYLDKMMQLNMIPTPELIRRDLFKDHPGIDEKINEITKRIQKKYGIDEEEYMQALTVTFQEDKDEMNFTQRFVSDLDNALMGHPPTLAGDIPDFMTKKKTLEVFGKLARMEREKLQEYLNATLEKDPSFWPNLHDKHRFLCAARVNLRFSDERDKIFAEEGLDAFDEAPERILDTAIANYSAESLEFQQELQDLQRNIEAFNQTFGTFWTFPEPADV